MIINFLNLKIPAGLIDTQNNIINLNEAFLDIIENSDEKRLMLYDLIIKNNPLFLYSIKNEEYLFIVLNLSDPTKKIIILITTNKIGNIIKETEIFKSMQNDFFNILGAIHDDFVIINSCGVITHALPNFELLYGIPSQEAIGKTVYEMEKRKIFNPSVAARVFKSKKAETMLQYTGANKYLMCTAIPIMDKYNNIEKVISYTRDITKYETLEMEYNNLEKTLKLYSAELEELRTYKSIPSVIGIDHSFQKIISMIQKIAKFDASVLFLGESGVGKSMFAKLMHSQSSRASGPFIEIHCSTIPENLIESELFGYEKGAFTGANKEGKMGLIELANKGTLFLDEIGDLPNQIQVKLLKVLQEKKITHIGGISEKTVDFRLITATNKDLETMVKKGDFREDLFYRLNVITFRIPSLRERKDDIFPLCDYFIQKITLKHNISRSISNRTLDYLINYHWPGNIRELENVIERLVLTSEGYLITPEDLPAPIRSEDFSTIIGENSLKEILEKVEKQVVLDALKKHKTSIGVAKALGISQPSASLKINKYCKSKKNSDLSEISA